MSLILLAFAVSNVRNLHAELLTLVSVPSVDSTAAADAFGFERTAPFADCHGVNAFALQMSKSTCGAGEFSLGPAPYTSDVVIPGSGEFVLDPGITNAGTPLSEIPEPGTVAVIAMGLASLAAVSRLKRRR